MISISNMISIFDLDFDEDLSFMEKEKAFIAEELEQFEQVLHDYDNSDGTDTDKEFMRCDFERLHKKIIQKMFVLRLMKRLMEKKGEITWDSSPVPVMYPAIDLRESDLVMFQRKVMIQTILDWIQVYSGKNTWTRKYSDTL